MKLFFEKVIEVGYLTESQCKGYFRNIPFALSEQNPRLLNQPIQNQLGGGFTGHFFYRPVEVIDVNI